MYICPFLSIALPLTNAFGVVPRNAGGASSRLFSSTLELSTAPLDVFNDFPSLDDMESVATQPEENGDESLFEQVNTAKTTTASTQSGMSIQVTQVSSVTDRASFAPYKEKPWASSPTTQAASVTKESNTDDKESTDDATQSRLMQETGMKSKGGRITASVRETGYDSMRNYLKSVCNHELLNKNEEIILAREIQILIKWEEKREELESNLMR